MTARPDTAAVAESAVGTKPQRGEVNQEKGQNQMTREDTELAGAVERLKARAHYLVRRAILKGDLVRPTQCEACGKNEPPTPDGRVRIHGHHEDHTKPLVVQWICIPCHRLVTPVRKDAPAPALGTANGQAKLTEEAVREIKASSGPKLALARRYGVHPKTIQKARNQTYWRHVQ